MYEQKETRPPGEGAAVLLPCGSEGPGPAYRLSIIQLRVSLWGQGDAVFEVISQHLYSSLSLSCPLTELLSLVLGSRSPWERKR